MLKTSTMSVLVTEVLKERVSDDHWLGLDAVLTSKAPSKIVRSPIDTPTPSLWLPKAASSTKARSKEAVLEFWKQFHAEGNMHAVLGGDRESPITLLDARQIVANQRCVALERVASDDPSLKHIVGRSTRQLQHFFLSLFDENDDAFEEKSQTLSESTGRSPCVVLSEMGIDVLDYSVTDSEHNSDYEDDHDKDDEDEDDVVDAVGAEDGHHLMAEVNSPHLVNDDSCLYLYSHYDLDMGDTSADFKPKRDRKQSALSSSSAELLETESKAAVVRGECLRSPKGALAPIREALRCEGQSDIDDDGFHMLQPLSDPGTDDDEGFHLIQPFSDADTDAVSICSLGDGCIEEDESELHLGLDLGLASLSLDEMEKKALGLMAFSTEEMDEKKEASTMQEFLGSTPPLAAELGSHRSSAKLSFFDPKAIEASGDTQLGNGVTQSDGRLSTKGVTLLASAMMFPGFS